MDTTVKPTLVSKLTRVAADCGYVQKDAANAFHKYRYVSAANILGHVNESLCAHGLAVVETDPQILSEVGTGKERVVTVRMKITVQDADSGERATFVGLGSGQDAGDKAVMKASTAAQKYAWMGALSISTGDDPEADVETDRRNTRSAKGREENNAKARDDGNAKNGTPDKERPTEPPSAALEGFHARVAEIELPGEAIAVWIKHRAELAQLPVQEKESAWQALCKRTEDVGKFKNAKVWLKKALAEEDARRITAQADGQAS